MNARPIPLFMRRICLTLAFLLFLWSSLPLVNLVYAEDDDKVDIPSFSEERMQAKAAYLFNADNGEILYAKNENEIMTPASLTKLMTLLLTEEKLQDKAIDEDDKVTISTEAWQTGGSSMFLEVGTSYKVKDLIKGTAIVSGNDASVSLAEHISGSTDAFIKLMNEKAKELGMTNTTFQTVHGLPAKGQKDLTTAKDMGILAQHYVNTYPHLLKIHSTKEYTTKMFPKGRSNVPKQITQSNSNTLLGEYEGMDGLKTGFSSYYNFIGTAKRGDIRLIVVVLGAESQNKRMNTASALLDFGFSHYQTFEVGKKGDEIASLNVYKSDDIKESVVALDADNAYSINIRDKERVVIENRIPDYLEGGTKKGDVIGKQVVLLDGEIIAEVDIIATEDVSKTNWFSSIFHQIALLFSQLLNKLADLL